MATGGIISSPGVPNTVTLPGVCVRVRYSATATAAARPMGPCVLCWSPWNAPLVPRSASYSTITPRLGAPLFCLYRATKAVGRPATPTVTSKPCLVSQSARIFTERVSVKPISGWRVMSSPIGRSSVSISSWARAVTASRAASGPVSLATMAGTFERSFERVEGVDDVARGRTFGIGFLGGKRNGERREYERGGEESAEGGHGGP